MPSIITAITAMVGVWFAKRGLDKWHAETIGKRKTELAEQALVSFYEARDAFVWARSQGIFGGDGMARPAIPEETAEQRNARNTYFIPLERLIQNKELFSKIQTLMYQFSAYFGVGSLEPFKKIRGCYNIIITSANVLIRVTNEDGKTAIPDGPDSGAPLRKTLWGMGDRPDDLDREIDSAVAAIEALCKPVLEKVGR